MLMQFGVYIEYLKKLTTIVLRLIFYVSGVFYNLNTRLDGTIRYLLLRCNPVAFCMNETRKVMIYSQLPSLKGLAFWYGIGLFLCFIGVKLIVKNENSYAKVI